MRRRRAPRIDLSAEMEDVDSTSIQESFLLEETRRKIEQVSRSECRQQVHKINNNTNIKNQNNGYESNEDDAIFMLHCTSPVSHTSAITMDLLSPASLSDSINLTDDLSLPTLPELRQIPTDEAIIGTVVGGTDMGTSFLPDTSPTTSNKGNGPTVFMDEDSFTYVTLEESKSSNSSGDVFNGISNAESYSARPTTLNSALRTPYRAAMHTPHSMQTPYTYETIEDSDAVNRTGVSSQFTFETLHTSGKENTPNRKTTARKSKRERINLAQDSPLEGRRIYSSVSPTPSSIAFIPQQDKKTKQMDTVDLDSFSIDQYASSPDKSADCFSIDSYSSFSEQDGLGIGGTGATNLDLARTKRDQSLFRLRSMGGGKFHSMRPLPPVPPPQCTSGGADGRISQRKNHVEKQRRRLSQVFQSYCQSMEV